MIFNQLFLTRLCYGYTVESESGSCWADHIVLFFAPGPEEGIAPFLSFDKERRYSNTME